jgi:hypothetical protein
VLRLEESKGNTTMKMRYNIEVGVAYGVPGGQWGTFFVEVIAKDTTPLATLKKRALAGALKELEQSDAQVGGMWVHWLGDEGEEIFEDED